MGIFGRKFRDGFDFQEERWCNELAAALAVYDLAVSVVLVVVVVAAVAAAVRVTPALVSAATAMALLASVDLIEGFADFVEGLGLSDNHPEVFLEHRRRKSSIFRKKKSIFYAEKDCL